MTRAEWDAACIRQIRDRCSLFPGRGTAQNIRDAQEWTTRAYGPMPAAVADPLPRPGVVSVVKTAWRMKSMGLKISVTTVVASVAAAASAFGAAWTAANLDNAVSTGEWVSIVWAVATAIVATLFHDTKPQV